MKNYRTWLIVAIVFQLVTGTIHSISLFIPMKATQESENQLVELFTTQRLDMGAGYFRTMSEIFLSVSTCLTLLYLFGGILNWYLLKKRLTSEIMGGVLTIQVLIYGICFIVIVVFAFLPPIVLTGLTFVFLLLARFTFSPSKST